MHCKVHVIVIISGLLVAPKLMGHTARKRFKTLTWVFGGLLAAFGIVALLTVLGIVGFLAIGFILFNPFLLVILGIAIIVIYFMMKNRGG